MELSSKPSTSQESVTNNAKSFRGFYDTWSDEEQKLLVQLWAENFEDINRSITRKKTWQQICDVINSRFGCCKSSMKCRRKIQYVIDCYNNAREWNSTHTGGHVRKSIFYDEIDAILGCKDALTEVVQLPASCKDVTKDVVEALDSDKSEGPSETASVGDGEQEWTPRQEMQTQHQARRCRKKPRKRPPVVTLTEVVVQLPASCKDVTKDVVQALDSDKSDGPSETASVGDGEQKWTPKQEMQTQHQARRCRKKPRKRPREEEQEEEEQDMLKQLFSDLKEQRSEMKDFIASFNEMQSQQMQTMNTFLGAMTQFLCQQSNNKE